MSTTYEVLASNGTNWTPTVNWTVTAPDSVTLQLPNYAVPVLNNPLTITIDYGWDDLFGSTAHGILDVLFAEPAVPTSNSTADFRLPVTFVIQNHLGVPIDGFSLYLANEEFPTAADLAIHPSSYAHWHGVFPNTFP